MAVGPLARPPYVGVTERGRGTGVGVGLAASAVNVVFRCEWVWVSISVDMFVDVGSSVVRVGGGTVNP